MIPKTIAFSQLYDVINALYGADQMLYTYYCSSKNRTVVLEKQAMKLVGFLIIYHTAGSDPIFIQIYTDAPPGVPGVSKNRIYFFTNKSVEFCAKIEPEWQKLQKLSKLEKKWPKMPVF